MVTINTYSPGPPSSSADNERNFKFKLCAILSRRDFLFMCLFTTLPGCCVMRREILRRVQGTERHDELRKIITNHFPLEQLFVLWKFFRTAKFASQSYLAPPSDGSSKLKVSASSSFDIVYLFLISQEERNSEFMRIEKIPNTYKHNAKLTNSMWSCEPHNYIGRGFLIAQWDFLGNKFWALNWMIGGIFVYDRKKFIDKDS